MSEFAALPKITQEIWAMWSGELELIGFVGDNFADPVWTQDAVDFAALVAGHLSQRIADLEAENGRLRVRVKMSDDLAAEYLLKRAAAERACAELLKRAEAAEAALAEIEHANDRGATYEEIAAILEEPQG